MSGSPSSDPPTPARSTRLEESAGGVVLRREGDQVQVLLILDPYGQWGLPKGHLEDGEGPKEAAIREVHEETGLEDVELGPAVETIDWYFRRNRVLVHKFCTFYLMCSRRGEAEPEVEEGITECLWLPLDSAADRVGYGNTREVVRAAVRMVRAEEHSFDL